MSLKSFFSYKAILNRNIKGHELTESEIKSFQRCLITISSEIIEVCEKYNLKLILQGGTLLGYIRHNGFIPWDDDIDFGIMRSDVYKLIEFFRKYSTVVIPGDYSKEAVPGKASLSKYNSVETASYIFILTFVNAPKQGVVTQFPF